MMIDKIIFMWCGNTFDQENDVIYMKHFSCSHGSFAPRGGHEYALKQIEGTGISMSACREIAVSISPTTFSSRTIIGRFK